MITLPNELASKVKAWLDANTNAAKVLIDPRRQLDDAELPAYTIIYEGTDFDPVEYGDDPARRPSQLYHVSHSLALDVHTARKGSAADRYRLIGLVRALPRALTDDNDGQLWQWSSWTKAEHEGENKDSEHTIKLHLTCKENET